MNFMTRWLDIRPEETHSLTLAVIGAFFIMAFVVLARSLREGLYLTCFAVETLPYITASVALLSLPAVEVFTRLLVRFPPRLVYKGVVLLVLAGLSLLWPSVESSPTVVILFYLWTALGTLLVTTGFWVVISDFFPVRGAKRLFGMIGAGGTAGVMIMGGCLHPLVHRLGITWLVGMLGVLLVAVLLVEMLLPALAREPGQMASEDEPESAGLAEGFRLLLQNRHLGTVALIVFVATAASTLVDFQFKEMARASVDAQADLVGFFGAFYGWTGAAALLLQLLVAGHMLTSNRGLTWGLAILPGVLLLGSAALLVVPGLFAATLLRGSDNALRKSLFRPTIEILFIPVSAQLRRKTKSLVDSVVDSGAEGIGALIVFLWVTLSGFPSRYLSFFVLILALVLLILSRRMGREYFRTISGRLREGEATAEQMVREANPHQEDLLSAVFTHLHITVPQAGDPTRNPVAVHGQPSTKTAGGIADILQKLTSSAEVEIVQALSRIEEWNVELLDALFQLLQRDTLYDRTVNKLVSLGDPIVPRLSRVISDEQTPFVVRRRLPAVLARLDSTQADDVLLDVLQVKRFEIRYRAAIALVRRRRADLPESTRDWREIVWNAVSREVRHDRPVWELQKLLDSHDLPDDELVVQQVNVRGSASLEHTFRMLTLVLDAQLVKAAYHGVILNDPPLKDYALEYLEQALPAAIRDQLWLFIGDLSEYRQNKETRPLTMVADDLMKTNVTLLGGEDIREALERMLRDRRK